MRCSVFIAAALCIGSLSTPAWAQCDPAWSADCSLSTCQIPGVNGNVHCATLFDDGTGPALIIGGEFTVAGSGLAGNLAKWNGTTLTPLAGGTNGRVSAMIVYDGELYIAGDFTSAGGLAAQRVAKFSGVDFLPVGPGFNAEVRALAVFNDVLIAGGSFTSSGATSVSRIAQFVGGNWQPLLGGVSGGSDVRVNALAVYRGELFVGGNFSFLGTTPTQTAVGSLGVWDGTNWRQLALGLGVFNGSISSMSLLGDAPNDVLILGGSFTFNGQFMNRVAQWDGAALNPMSFGFNSTVQALHVLEGVLYAGGAFTQSGPTLINFLSRWSGTDWEAIGVGTDAPINALGSRESELVLGGEFVLADQVGVSRVARVDVRSDTFAVLGAGINDDVLALAVVNDQIYIGGEFLSGPGGVAADRIAQFDGTNWNALGDGVDAAVRDIQPIGTDVFVVGDFQNAGGAPAARVARWDGSAWNAVGDGVDDAARAAIDFGGQLVVAGDFLNSGATPVARVARLSGTSFEALGDGLDGRVHALVVFNNELFAGGEFGNSGATAAPRLARFDGTAWQSVASDLTGRIRAMAIFNNELIIGGTFTRAGNVTANGIARFDGTAFRAFPEGWTSGEVTSIGTLDGELYVGGAFTVTGQAATQHVLRFDGTAWTTVTPDADAPPTALAGFRENLLAVGGFAQAGGRAAAGIAQIVAAGNAPSIDDEPVSVSGCIGEQVQLIVNASGSGILVFQWRKDQVNIDNEISNTLTFTSLEAADQGDYDCVITSDCGTITSAPATITVRRGPTINTQPTVQVLNERTSGTLAVVATGTGTLRFQWRKDGMNLTDGNGISGSTTATLRLDAVDLADSGQYDVVVGNGCGDVTSNRVALSVRSVATNGNANQNTNSTPNTNVNADGENGNKNGSDELPDNNTNTNSVMTGPVDDGTTRPDPDEVDPNVIADAAGCGAGCGAGMNFALLFTSLALLSVRSRRLARSRKSRA
ncbi:MAG: immunoglobulin domain-containing protein [Phycisphaerae bacterium]